MEKQNSNKSPHVPLHPGDEDSVPHILAHFWFKGTAQHLCWVLTLLTENRTYPQPSLPWTLSAVFACLIVGLQHHHWIIF